MPIQIPMRAPDPARKARQEQLMALVQSPEWQLVRQGLAGRLARTKDSLAFGFQMSEQQVRESQAICRLLSELLRDPITYLTQFVENEGDDR